MGGIEADAAWGNSSMSQNGIPGTFGNSGMTLFVPGPPAAVTITGLEAELGDSSSVKLGWDSSLRARLGFLLLPDILLYGTGGVSFQEVAVSASCSGPTAGPTAVSPSYCQSGAHSESASRLMVGYTIGGGIEAAFDANWLSEISFFNSSVKMLLI